MSISYNDLDPKSLWINFNKLSAVPRPSRHEKEVTKFIKEFGVNLGLETIVDKTGNVIIKKHASKGFENRKGVILQSHLDMVPQKNLEVAHNFFKDPIIPLIDGDWVKARGTTLGADNGIGVAAMMSVLESQSISHGPLEALFTVEEETGLVGAFAINPDILKGQVLLNLDSEEDGELFIGCAGGIDANIKFHYIEEPVPNDFSAFNVSIGGLNGGHSGLDINLGRGNAIKLLNRFLWIASKDYGIRVSSILGGSLRNVIPREASSIIVVMDKNKKDLLDFAKEYRQTINFELSSVEEDIKFDVKSSEIPYTLIDESIQHSLLNAVYACPNGVIRMSNTMPGVVETSTNLSVIEMKNGIISIGCLLRSSVESAKRDLANMIDSVFHLGGADISLDGDYPGWNPNTSSEILKLMKSIYKKEFGVNPEVKVIHAGLECGIIGGIYPGLDMISFGPTIRGAHSPEERVNILSVNNFWRFLKIVLANIQYR